MRKCKKCGKESFGGKFAPPKGELGAHRFCGITCYEKFWKKGEYKDE